jgi:SAM-dependent methyltransferase
MNRFLHGVARALAESFELPGPVLEIGSYQVPGQEHLINLRTLFRGREHIGLDMRAGPGVDLVGDVEKLDLPDASVGTVVALCCFEHVQHFWRGLDEVFRVLRPDGAFFLATPFHFRIHNHPSDYWRFTPEAYELLLERYHSGMIGWHGTRNRPEHVWAMAYREKHAPITPEQTAAFALQMARSAKQPLGWWRRLRYGLASLISGRGPFAAKLDRERWQAEARQAAGQSWRVGHERAASSAAAA